MEKKRIKSKYHTIAGTHTTTPLPPAKPLHASAAVDVTAPRTLSMVSVIKCFKFQMHSTLNAKKVKYLPTHHPTPISVAFFVPLSGAGFEANSHALRLNYMSKRVLFSGAQLSRFFLRVFRGSFPLVCH